MILLKRIIEQWMKAKFSVTMLILHQRIFLQVEKNFLHFSNPLLYTISYNIVMIVFRFSVSKAIGQN